MSGSFAERQVGIMMNKLKLMGIVFCALVFLGTLSYAFISGSGKDLESTSQISDNLISLSPIMLISLALGIKLSLSIIGGRSRNRAVSKDSSDK